MHSLLSAIGDWGVWLHVEPRRGLARVSDKVPGGNSARRVRAAQDLVPPHPACCCREQVSRCPYAPGPPIWESDLWQQDVRMGCCRSLTSRTCPPATYGEVIITPCLGLISRAQEFDRSRWPTRAWAAIPFDRGSPAPPVTGYCLAMVSDAWGNLRWGR